MKKFLTALVLLGGTGVLSTGFSAETTLADWQFTRDGKAWQNVVVPHDWAIAGPFDIKCDAQLVTVKEDGEDKPRLRVGRTGALPWVGAGRYRRTVELPKGCKVAELVFDGTMMGCEVLVDGKSVYKRPFGYAPFVVPLDAAMQKHVVEVSIDNKEESSRWYPGAGIIRKVKLRTDPQFRAEETFIYVERLEKDCAHMVVKGAKGERRFEVKNPKLWTPETPYLYTLEPEGIRYGIRTLEWKGGVFKLNGKVRKFNGVCMHHDLGPIGAAFNAAAFRRQVRLLKEIGCDAIRTSHNIPCGEQLDICDEMGMMIMAESFDEWREPKCSNGYHNAFDAWWRKDLTALARFHRNHPSVVMWSIGNEILDQRTKAGTALTRQLQALMHDEDPTRPVTQGHSWMPYAIDAGGVQEMDIPGVTYRLPFYEALHKASKYGGVLGVETASTVSSRGFYAFPDKDGFDCRYPSQQSSSYDLECAGWSNLPDDDWAMQEDHPWTMGEFAWTGFDYLGEPYPYDAEPSHSRSSYFGIYDLAGLPKDRVYLYRAHWRKDVATLHVLPHWTWPGREGKVTPVYVYTSYPEAELFINGKSQGRRKFNKASRLDRYRLRWRETKYEPGELKVVAYDAAGRAAATKVVRTAGVPAKMSLTVEPSQAGDDLRFVDVDIVDALGNLCPNAQNTLTFKVTGGGRFRAACNGDPTDLESFGSGRMKAFNGRLVVIIEQGKEPCELEVTAEGLPVVRLRLNGI